MHFCTPAPSIIFLRACLKKMELATALTIIYMLFLYELRDLAIAHASMRDPDSNLDLSFFSSNLLKESCIDGTAHPTRKYVASITDFGGVGDGTTFNTEAFKKAISHLSVLAMHGGAKLSVPAGKWLTGSFNLTSHFTLYLEKDAVILASQNPGDWPVIQPLPSYGRGRELPGGRYISLIHGQNLVDIVITGEGGTIDGQGSVWWEMWRNGTLEHTRGHLIEFISSENIIISNIVLANSPFWTAHPVYCNNVIVKSVTIIAPPDSPNTDGVDPDSSSNVCIEDCYISNGDDLIALKSGWDEYGIAFGHPTSNVIIRRISGTTPFAGIAIGSEMSGGVRNVFIKDINLFNTSVGIRLKTAPGRGGYISDIAISGITLDKVGTAIEFTGNNAQHPDANYNPNALPVVNDIVIKNMVGEQVSYAGRFTGLKAAPFRDICLSSITLDSPLDNTWKCSNVEGSSFSVSPLPCIELNSSVWHSTCLSFLE
eukprot:c24562_g2_i1 orf=1022-2473(+)